MDKIGLLLYIITKIFFVIPIFFVIGFITGIFTSISWALNSFWSFWAKDTIKHGGFIWAIRIVYMSAQETWNKERWIGFKEMQRIEKRRSFEKRKNAVTS